MLIHYVCYPSRHDKRILIPQLYPICGRGTWETARGWTEAPYGSVITCFGCIAKQHKTFWPSDYALMFHESR